jgi:hypothetical protein
MAAEDNAIEQTNKHPLHDTPTTEGTVNTEDLPNNIPSGSHPWDTL